MNLSKFQIRLFSALVMFPPVILIVYLGGLYFAGLLTLTFLISLYEWLRLSKMTQHFYAFAGAGVLYICIGFYLFYHLRELPDIGLILTILAFVSVWCSDTFAYIFGKLIGGPKLIPSISPNKTRIGLVGAMFGSAIALLLGKIILDILNIPEPEMSYAFILTSGALLGIVAQAGDLLVSFLKRQAKMKDSGNIIPGHGGLLDRIDALMLVAPVFYVTTIIFLVGG